MDGSGPPIAAGPPTRDHRGENFPVASLLLSRRLRPKVLAFYRFVRTADDIADHPSLPPEEKLARLDAMEAALEDPTTPLPEAQALHALGVGTAEARRMLSAFRQDATRRRYTDWAELEDYCARSAVPVGRMLLRLHEETDAEAIAAADALCTALQILNHLQDLVPDRDRLGRIYLPTPWMELAGGETAFFAPTNAARRRAVLDAALDRAEATLESAAALPRRLSSRRLARESAVTLALARRLLARLRAADPVLGRVALTRSDAAAAVAGLALPPPSDAALVRIRVARARSSFSRGMAALRGERRRALWAVYAFCRSVDDIADAAFPAAEKRRFLEAWRAKLAAPDCALSRELAWARANFALPAAECEAMIEGMATDATAAPLRLPDAAALDLYCRRVAGSVGAMAVRIFGAGEAAGGFGVALGRTLQLVNILRDLDEDAARERLYLPLDLLAAHGVADGPASEILAAPGFPAACRALAQDARRGFELAEAELRSLPDARRAALLPARIMMWGYRRLLDRLLERGFDGARRERAKLTKLDRARMAAFALRLAPVGEGPGR